MRHPIDLANALRTLSRQFAETSVARIDLAQAAEFLENAATTPTNAKREALAAQLDDFAASLAGDIREQRPLLTEAASVLRSTLPPTSAEREALAARLLDLDHVTDDLIRRAANALRAMPSDATPEAVEEARKHRATLRVVWAKNAGTTNESRTHADQVEALQWAAYGAGATMTPHDKPEELYPLIAAAREDLAEQLRSRAIVIEASGFPDQLFRENTVRDLKRAADMLAPPDMNEAPVSHASTQNPIPMLLRCPFCHERHVDEGEFATRSHKTHVCQNSKCGELFTPALMPTVGVRFLPGCENER